MAGVRRWIGSQPPRNQRNQGGSSDISEEAAPKEPEKDTHSTEYIIAHLLDPTVSPEEETEYQGYADNALVIHLQGSRLSSGISIRSRIC
jgi:hypothetical protein